jgi:hypothetical protein
MVLSISVFNFADVHSIIVAEANPTGFTDVPATHWAYADIMALAKGGLVNGMGDGTFAPDKTLTIAQMAKIICAAKGLGDNASGYWATEYIRICQNDVKCLPNFGEINKANYDVPCTRELAAYMIVNGLGLKTSDSQGKQLTDIPDWTQIDDAYSQAVLRAYNAKLLTGMDDKGTFAPKSPLTRAQVCAILNRAGFTKAAEKPATVGTGADAKSILANAKTWNDVTWKEETYGNTTYLTATDRQWGGVTIEYRNNAAGGREVIIISLDERYTDAFTDEDYEKSWTAFNENTVVTVPSGFSYDARRLVMRVLKQAFPTGFNEAYTALIDVMKQDIFERPNKNGAAAVRWIDGRMYDVSIADGQGGISISIDQVGFTKGYESALAAKEVPHGKMFVSAFGGAYDLTTMYELDRPMLDNP